MRTCRVCNKEKSIEEFSQYKLGFWRRLCKVCENRQVVAKNKSDPSFVSRRRNTLLRFKYKISQADFERILESQGGMCAICTSRDEYDFCVDHYNNKVRGILCRRCNLGIGFLNTIGLLERAYEYVDRNLEP